MMFDTDVLIWAARGNEMASDLIEKTDHRVLSIISFMELLQRARSKMEARQIRQFLSRLLFTIVPLSEAIGYSATALVERYALTHGIQVADALIAATAITAGESLCTGNVKHFRSLRGLSVVAFRPGTS